MATTADRDTAAHGRRRLAVLFAVLAVLASLVRVSDALGAETAADDEPAYRLESGSVARSRIVALGRDLVVEGDAQSHVVAINGSATVAGRIDGDLIVLGGNASLDARARIKGDVFVLGGRIEAAPGAMIEGRSVAYPDASSAWLSLIEGPTVGLAPHSRVVLGAKLALLAFWAVLILLLFTVSGRELVSTSESVISDPFRNFMVGLTGVLAMTMTALFFSAFSGALLGVPLLVLVAVVALGLRFWGMVAVFHALGSWLGRRRGPRRAPLPVTAACLGLAVLGILKFLPWVGVWVWTIATFIGVGAALTTKLGRREPWFSPI